MVSNDYRNLEVWVQAHRLVLKIYQVTVKFPKVEQLGIVSQMRHSSVAVCSSILEGYMKGHKGFLKFLYIAQTFLEETKYYLILSKDLEYYDNAQFKEVFKLADKISDMLANLIGKLSKK